MTRTRTLRVLLDNPDIVVLPGAYDALTARLAERSGFGAIYMSGGATVNAHLGIPDIDLASMSDMVDNARRMCAAVDVPLVCDADTGYGNALSVMRTVKAFENAGAAGIHLEDQRSPKRCGHLDGKRLVSVEEMEGKIEAACAARRNDEFVVIARTDARSVDGFEAAIERATRYVAAGADVIFPEALETKEEFGRFAESDVGAPLLANMTEFGKTPLISSEEFEDLGYAAVIFPMTALRVTLRAVERAYEQLWREGSQASLMEEMWTRQQQYELLDYAGYERWEQRYVPEA